MAMLMTAISATTTQAVDAVINVGLVDTNKTNAKHSTITASTTDVTVGLNQAIGAFTTDGKLITSFGTYECKNNLFSSDEITSGQGASVSNNLKVNGTLTISDNGQVYLGGQIKITNISKRDSYSGLIADTVEINGDGKTTNLQIESATIGTLTLNSGIAKIHTTGSSGGNSVSDSSAATVGTDCKIAKFDKAINVNGGSLQLGYVSRAQSGSSHYMTYLSKNVAVTQTGGTISIAGQARLSDGVNITQSGGTFKTTTTVNGDMAFELGAGNFNISQINPEEIKENSNGPTLTINRLASTADSKKLNISQTSDKGSINLTAGLNVSNSKFALKETSKLTQNSVEGKINFYGDFSGAKYDIEQEGTGTININTDCTFKANNVTIGSGSNFNIDGSMTIYGTAKLNGNVTVNGTLEESSSLLEIVGGKVENSGTINMDISMSGGELTAMDKSAFANITATSGTIYLGENITLGTLTLGVDANIASTFALRNQQNGVTVYVGEGGVLVDELNILGDNVTFVAKTEGSLEDISAPITLFYSTTEGTEYDLGNAKLFVQDVTGEQTEVAFKDNGDGTVTVTGAIPEPTTATLSLLALAALAARRRRK